MQDAIYFELRVNGRPQHALRRAYDAYIYLADESSVRYWGDLEYIPDPLRPVLEYR